MNVRRTAIVSIDPTQPEIDVLRQAARVIQSGGLVAFPTETVYGLGASARVGEFVRRIFEAKGRPATNPLIVHVADRQMLRDVVAGWPLAADRLMSEFWPGPLTLVLPKGPHVPNLVTAGGATVAVRMPNHAVAMGLIRECGFPLAAPSANRSSELSPTRAEHVFGGLSGRIDMILDAGATSGGIESTVVDLSKPTPVLLRPGPVTLAQLQAVIGAVERWHPIEETHSLPSPGMLAKHYSPRTPVELFSSREELLRRAAKIDGVGKLLFGGVDHSAIVMPTDSAAYASRLYAELHHLDSQWLKRILIELPPETDEWLAVRDRLTRAAAK